MPGNHVSCMPPNLLMVSSLFWNQCSQWMWNQTTVMGKLHWNRSCILEHAISLGCSNLHSRSYPPVFTAPEYLQISPVYQETAQAIIQKLGSAKGLGFRRYEQACFHHDEQQQLIIF